ncbi:MAG: PAS domain S-box protein [Desulfovermiculus sp.]|nr:PAS domain S-box protein [Desulfovermiculus sp.]
MTDRQLSSYEELLHRLETAKEPGQVEWMLSPAKLESADYTPEYGDLSLLNQKGLILSSVGKDRLRDMAWEYLDLLETSAAVYELNGDYALGLFSSEWCRLLDAASRKLCNTDDNRQAMHSGQWLCHESCWQVSLAAMQEGESMDVSCHGGIRLYAVPVRARGKIVGAINFGYGDPPRDEGVLQELCEKYRLPIEDLRKQADAYPSRPQFIVDYAKARIHKAAGYLGYIIEREQAEQELKEREEKFRAVFEAANVGKSITLLSGEICVNLAFCDMLGYTKEELENTKWQGVTFPEDIEYSQEVITQLANNEKDATRFAKRYIHKNGSIVWADVSVAMKRDKDDRPQYMITTVVDITAQKSSEQRLEITQYGIDNAQIGIYQVEEDGRIVYANHYAARTLGYSIEDLYGKSLFEIDPTFDFEKFKKHREETRLRGSNTIISKHRRKDGSEFPVEVTVNYFQYAEKMLSFSFVKDITERRQQEDELRQLKDHLATEVAEKTKELQERVAELERFHDATIQREFRIKELREEIQRLKGEKS